MRLQEITIKNFRAYKSETVFKLDDLTVIVGKNDVGKSTILEALDVFFNDGKGITKIDKTDVNVSERDEGNLETVISAVFSDVPDSIVIDSTAETSLSKEYLLNENGMLEIVKRFNNGGNPKVYIKALHPTNGIAKDLLLKRNAELRGIVSENSIECQNVASNVLLRESIRNACENELGCAVIEIDASKEDAKKIWEKLVPYLPTYSLFQADRKNSDGDVEIQDPLKEAVKQILKDEEIQEALELVANKVHEKLQNVASRTLEKINEMDENIASSLNPVIPATSSLKWQDVFKGVSISGDENIPINKRGSGVKRIILLNFFRAEVERRFSEGDNSGIIYAIEEPETAQHSNNQLKLIDSLKTLSQLANVQVVLTTHSSFIVKQLEYSNLRLVKDCDGGIKNIVEVQEGQLKYPSLNEVNYLAFNDATEEYHDELYSYIEFQKWKNEYITDRPQRLYKRILQNGTVREEQKVLSEYIRHRIHHPENTLNDDYSREELIQSINEMREFIALKNETDGLTDPED